MCLLVTLAAPPQQPSERPTWNFIGTVALPPQQQDGLTREVAAELASSKVRTALDAEAAYVHALAIAGSALSQDEGVRVVGLFWVETGKELRDGVPTSTRELMWELNIGPVPWTRRVFWISAETGAMIQLFPAAKN
jgi:hypothetical protein